MELEILVVEPAIDGSGLWFVGLKKNEDKDIIGVFVDTNTELSAANRVLHQQDSPITQREYDCYRHHINSGEIKQYDTRVENLIKFALDA